MNALEYRTLTATCTTIPLYEYISNAYFLSDDPYDLAQEGSDGQMDKSR